MTMAKNNGPELLDATKTKKEIERLYHSSDHQIFLSAFFTESAYMWLLDLSTGVPLKLVIRAKPSDFLSGASDFGAVRKAYNSNWDIRFISILHAKVYLLGGKIVVGSGNLTANGMHLLRTGNLEFNSIIDASTTSRELVEAVFREAQAFNEDNLDRMETFLSENGREIERHDWWPPEVVPPPRRELFCNDFPRDTIDAHADGCSELWPGIARSLKNGDTQKAIKLFQNSQPFVWLRDSVEAAGGSLHFGGLTKALHDALADDPAPYRSTVKGLLANLLTFLQEMPEVGMVVEQPRHSQIVKII